MQCTIKSNLTWKNFYVMLNAKNNPVLTLKKLFMAFKCLTSWVPRLLTLDQKRVRINISNAEISLNTKTVRTVHF